MKFGVVDVPNPPVGPEMMLREILPALPEVDEVLNDRSSQQPFVPISPALPLPDGSRTDCPIATEMLPPAPVVPLVSMKRQGDATPVLLKVMFPKATDRSTAPPLPLEDVLIARLKLIPERAIADISPPDSAPDVFIFRNAEPLPELPKDMEPEGVSNDTAPPEAAGPVPFV